MDILDRTGKLLKSTSESLDRAEVLSKRIAASKEAIANYCYGVAKHLVEEETTLSQIQSELEALYKERTLLFNRHRSGDLEYARYKELCDACSERIDGLLKSIKRQ